MDAGCSHRVKDFSRFTIAAFVAGLLLGVPIGYSLNLDKNFEQIIIDEESFQTSEDQFINQEKRKVENEIIFKTIVFPDFDPHFPLTIN